MHTRNEREMNELEKREKEYTARSVPYLFCRVLETVEPFFFNIIDAMNGRNESNQTFIHVPSSVLPSLVDSSFATATSWSPSPSFSPSSLCATEPKRAPNPKRGI